MDIYRTTEHGVACAAAGLFVSKIGFNRQCIYTARCLVSNSTESHGYMCSRFFPGGGQCPLVKLLEIPTSPSLYMLIKHIPTYCHYCRSGIL